MSLLDDAAHWIREALAFTPDFAAYLWFPVLVVAVFIAAMLFVRRLLPLAGKWGAASLRVLSALVGAALLVPDVVVATVFRRVQKRPPALLYHYGDAVAASMTGLARTSGAVAGGFAKLARIPVLLVMVGCAAVIWSWNHGHCPAPASTACVRPFTTWVNAFSDDQPPPAPKTPAPKPKKKA